MRLKTLEQVHLGAATVSSRLSEMEAQVRGLAGELGGNREVLDVYVYGIWYMLYGMIMLLY
jgi:hypothetical protein